MGTVCWNCQGILLIDWLPAQSTVNTGVSGHTGPSSLCRSEEAAKNMGVGCCCSTTMPDSIPVLPTFIVPLVVVVIAVIHGVSFSAALRSIGWDQASQQ